MALEILSLKLPKQMLGELEQISEVTGLSKSDLARRAVEDFIVKMATSPHNLFSVLREGKVEYSVTKANGEQQEG